MNSYHLDPVTTHPPPKKPKHKKQPKPFFKLSSRSIKKFEVGFRVFLHIPDPPLLRVHQQGLSPRECLPVPDHDDDGDGDRIRDHALHHGGPDVRIRLEGHATNNQWHILPSCFDWNRGPV